MSVVAFFFLNGTRILLERLYQPVSRWPEQCILKIMNIISHIMRYSSKAISPLTPSPTCPQKLVSLSFYRHVRAHAHTHTTTENI